MIKGCVVTVVIISDSSPQQQLRNHLYTACCVANLNMLQKVLQVSGNSQDTAQLMSTSSADSLLQTVCELRSCITLDGSLASTKTLSSNENKAPNELDGTKRLVNSELANDDDFSRPDNNHSVPTRSNTGIDVPNSDAVLSQVLNEALSSDGQTALHLAANRDHWKLIVPLLAAGANPAIK